MKSQTVEIQKEIFSAKSSMLKKYQKLIVGKLDTLSLIKYEIVIMSTSWVPGALGLFLRAKLYPLLMKKVGRRVFFGQNIVLRHPHKIIIGDEVVIDDNVVLDAKGWDNDGITIGNKVFIGRGVLLVCKNGNINMGNYSNIGINCYIASSSQVNLGEKVLLAANCSLISGTHKFDRLDLAPSEQERESIGIELKDNVWLGANVQVMDGVTIGRDSIIGTSAVVNKDIPEYSIAVGVPAKKIKSRSDTDSEKDTFKQDLKEV